MGKKENSLKYNTLANIPDNVRLFRINAGMAWAGAIVKKTYNAVILKNPRPFHGAPQGFPDLIGWESIEITPDMVGKKVAVFLAYEIKATGKLSPEQNNFRKILESRGRNFT